MDTSQFAMRKTTLLLILLTTLGQFAFSQKKAEKAIRNAYKSYQAAILENEGEKAVSHVDSRTIEYYSNLVNWAVTADSITVDGLPLMDKLAVLLVRGRTAKERLMSMDGRDLLISGVDEGMVGKGNVVHHDIGAISIKRKSATAQFINKGKTTPVKYQFYKEKRKWKINLTSALSGSEKAFSEMIERSGKSQNEFLMDVVEDAAGEEAMKTIWKPLR